MTKHSWAKNPAYKRWVKQRDVALEVLHKKAQLNSSRVMIGVLNNVTMLAKSQWHALHNPVGHHSIDQFDLQLKQMLRDAAGQLYGQTVSLRRKSYLLAKASEAEIIAQLASPNKRVTARITAADLHRLGTAKSFAGGDLHHRITYYMDKLRRKIVSMAQASALTSESPEDFAFMVARAYPRASRFLRPKRILKPKLMESDSMLDQFRNQHDPDATLNLDDDGEDKAIDQIDEPEWLNMVNDYKTEYVPDSRAGGMAAEQVITDQGDQIYAWEFERDLTNEFVDAVRNGQIDAANENGITDFVWIAVVDAATDACCLWRDGLLVSEIQDQLGDHQDEDESCDVGGEGLTPPLHFNCRCTLAPATENVPDKPDDGSKDFETWLNT